MKIQTNKELVNNSYNVEIKILELDIGNYIEAIHDFGETPINFGGIIKDADDATLAVIADRNLKITEIAINPMKQSFSVTQYGNIAEKIALRWTDECVEKIDNYVKLMSSKTDTFTSIETIDI